jgi:hypothetical protein
MPTVNLRTNSTAAVACSVTAAVVFSILVLAPVAALATSVIKLSDEALAYKSSRIVEGTVAGVSSAWNTDHTQIHTTVTFNVASTMKGTAPAHGRLTLHLLGGRVGRKVMSLVGGPTFKEGEDVILFIDSTAPDLMPITGLFQGKFTVARDSVTGERIIVERGEPVAAFRERITRYISENGGDR